MAVAAALLGSCGGAAADAVCGEAAIEGQRIAPIEDAAGCGITWPVEVDRVAGVTLTPAPTLTCGTARALEAWVRAEVAPAVQLRGTRLDGLEIAAHYVCRNVNRAEDGKLSEHARGRAVDISALLVADGRRLAVLEDWEAPGLGGLLPWIYAGACGHFATTLGPGSDAYHEDHFHFDTAPRGTSYCR